MRLKRSLVSLSRKNNSQCQPKLARNQFGSGFRADPCISSVKTAIMITTSAPLKRGVRRPINYSGNAAPQLFCSTLLEQVFVLRVSNDQCALRAGADHKLGPIYARRGRDE